MLKSTILIVKWLIQTVQLFAHFTIQTIPALNIFISALVRSYTYSEISWHVWFAFLYTLQNLTSHCFFAFINCLVILADMERTTSNSTPFDHNASSAT